MTEFWDLLKKIKKADYKAKEVGKAEVTVEEAETQIRFLERGTWASGAHFSNLYEWSKEKDGFILKHLRYGKENPVELLYFSSDLKAREPHFCGPDQYVGKIVLNEDSFTLSWEISGPKKNDKIEIFYS